MKDEPDIDVAVAMQQVMRALMTAMHKSESEIATYFETQNPEAFRQSIWMVRHLWAIVEAEEKHRIAKGKTK